MQEYPQPEQLRLLLLEGNTEQALALQTQIRAIDSISVELITAETVADAEALLRSQAFDVVVAALDLLDVCGMEVVTRLNGANDDAPIIVLHTATEEPLALKLLQHGAQDYLPRAETEQRWILRALRYAIERKQVERHLTFPSQYDRLTCLPNPELFRDWAATNSLSFLKNSPISVTQEWLPTRYFPL